MKWQDSPGSVFELRKGMQVTEEEHTTDVNTMSVYEYDEAGGVYLLDIPPRFAVEVGDRIQTKDDPSYVWATVEGMYLLHDDDRKTINNRTGRVLLVTYADGVYPDQDGVVFEIEGWHIAAYQGNGTAVPPSAAQTPPNAAPAPYQPRPGHLVLYKGPQRSARALGARRMWVVIAKTRGRQNEWNIAPLNGDDRFKADYIFGVGPENLHHLRLNSYDA